MARMAELKSKLEALRKEMSEQGKSALQQDFKEFFDANPKILAVRWKQYTPYFNDGDPCTFSVHEPYISLEGANEEGGDYDDGFYNDYNDEVSKAVWKPFDKFWGEVCVEEVFQTVFDDHVRVTASRDGFDVEEYDHD